MIKILLALVLVGLVLAIVGVALFAESLAQRRAKRIRTQVRIELKNPDAAWLYQQGLSPKEIDLAFQRHNQLR